MHLPLALPFRFHLLISLSQAATIIGSSDLLSVAYAAQMENWLGNDPTLSYSSSLAFTNIFDKGPLNYSFFHILVDGQGPTFFVAEARTLGSDDAYSIIGGFIQPVRILQAGGLTPIPQQKQTGLRLYSIFRQAKGEIKSPLLKASIRLTTVCPGALALEEATIFLCRV